MPAAAVLTRCPTGPCVRARAPQTGVCASPGSMSVGYRRLRKLPRNAKDSDQESVPHPPISDGSSERFAVDAVRETQIDTAGFIKTFELLVGKFRIQTGQIVLELRKFPCSDDRDDWHGAVLNLQSDEL